MQTQKKLLTLLCAGTALGLMACGGGGSSAPTPPPPVIVDPPPPVAQTPQEQAGAGFAFVFNKGPFETPVNVAPADVQPLDKTAEPIAIP